MQQSWAVCDPKKKKSSDENEMVEDMIVIACDSDQLRMYDDDSWILHWSYSWQINKLLGYFSITLLLLFYVLTLP